MRAIAMWCVLLLPASIEAAAPVRVIFDTDMVTDCDDLGAQAVLHALADLGEVEILATVTSSRHAWSPACIDAVNTFYGRPDLPIGRPHGQAPDFPSKFARRVAERFPHDTSDLDKVPDALEVYARTLAAQPDGETTIVTVGYLTNVAGLLKLPATADRPSGLDLARRKVKAWVCMGGNFIGKPAVDDLKLGNVNFTRDADSALYAIRRWPGKLTFVGREVASVPSGLKVGARLAELPESNPIRVGYAAYFDGRPKDRHVADQATVLYAVRGLGTFWEIETRGFMDLRPDMTFRWEGSEEKGQAYLLKRPAPDRRHDRAAEEAIDALMLRAPGK